MKRWLSWPPLHFLVLGILLYITIAVSEGRAARVVAYPAPERIQSLSDDWVRQTGRFPDEDTLRHLIETEIDDEVLFAEALRRNLHRSDPVVHQRLLRDADFLGIEGSQREKLATVIELGVHRSDEVVRRRLIQRMQALGRAHDDTAAPDVLLRERYESDMARWTQPARLQLSHIYFSADGDSDSLQAAQRLLQQLRAQGIGPDQAAQHGDPFLHGNHFPLTATPSLTFFFGSDLVDQLMMNLDQGGKWIGPLASVFGHHLVWLETVELARARPFEEVKAELQREWQEEQAQKALQQYVTELRADYRVVKR